VERAHAAGDGAATRGAAVEQADDLGPAARIDVHDQGRDIREHEVEADAGTVVVELGAAAVALGAADVIDDVALAQRAERVADRDRDRGLVGGPAGGRT